jgi:hypothetical protein
LTFWSHIFEIMISIINRKRGKISGAEKPATAGAGSDRTAQGGAPEGLDARRLAEWKADEAGRNAREAAAARGEATNETGGPQGLEPTRYGDWERAGRCVDF